jgi:hypothetical protein
MRLEEVQVMQKEVRKLKQIIKDTPWWKKKIF